MNENFTKRPSSQNTFFLSSGILDELDNYLKEPKDRNSRILSLRNIQPPKENPSPTYETTNPIDTNFEEIEDVIVCFFLLTLIARYLNNFFVKYFLYSWPFISPQIQYKNSIYVFVCWHQFD